MCLFMPFYLQILGKFGSCILELYAFFYFGKCLSKIQISEGKCFSLKWEGACSKFRCLVLILAWLDVAGITIEDLDLERIAGLFLLETTLMKREHVLAVIQASGGQVGEMQLVSGVSLSNPMRGMALMTIILVKTTMMKAESDAVVIQG